MIQPSSFNFLILLFFFSLTLSSTGLAAWGIHLNSDTGSLVEQAYFGKILDIYVNILTIAERDWDHYRDEADTTAGRSWLNVDPNTSLSISFN